VKKGKTHYPDNLVVLVALTVGARRAGDQAFERGARRRLLERFGVRLSFTRNFARLTPRHAADVPEDSG
jgi:hypothetical protein